MGRRLYQRGFILSLTLPLYILLCILETALLAIGNRGVVINMGESIRGRTLVMLTQWGEGPEGLASVLSRDKFLALAAISQSTGSLLTFTYPTNLIYVFQGGVCSELICFTSFTLQMCTWKEEKKYKL